MRKLIEMANRFRREEDGAAMIEYSVLVGIITAAAIGLILAVGTFVTNSWSNLCDDLAATDAGCVTPS